MPAAATTRLPAAARVATISALALILGLAAAIATMGAALAAPPAMPLPSVTPADARWKSSAGCKGCHPAIYEEWQASRHASAGLEAGGLYDKVWQKFAPALKAKWGAPAFFCAVCHSPSAPNLADLAAGKAAPTPGDRGQKEGVGCQFCHSITGVEDHPVMSSYVLEVGRTYRGPLLDAQPKGHQGAYSPLHLSGRLCAGCHGHLKLEKVEICNMDEELAAAPLACQSCHMPPVLGPPARGSHRATHASHLAPGGHQPGMLSRAAALAMAVEGGQVTVTVTNRAPHKLPTTQPLRVMALQVQALDAGGKVVWSNWEGSPPADSPVLFMKKFGAGGKVGVPTWQAETVAADTRLAPLGQWQLKLPLPAGVKAAKVRARLIYRLAPPQLVKELGLDPASPVAQPQVIAQAEVGL